LTPFIQIGTTTNGYKRTTEILMEKETVTNFNEEEIMNVLTRKQFERIVGVDMRNNETKADNKAGIIERRNFKAFYFFIDGQIIK
jgi:hypothetical protein